MRQLWLKSVVAGVSAFLLFATGCASSDVSGGPLPGDPPWGLDSIELPDNARAAEAVLSEMPGSIGAMDQINLDQLSARYAGGGENVSIHIGTMDEARQFAGDPDITLVEFMTALLGSGDLEAVEGSEVDPNQSLVWASVSVRAGEQIIYAATWGKPDGEWAFNVEASSPEARRDLIHAFVSAVQA